MQLRFRFVELHLTYSLHHLFIKVVLHDVWRIVMMFFFQTCVTQIMLPVIMSDDDSLVEHDRQAIMRKKWKEDSHFRPRYIH